MIREELIQFLWKHRLFDQNRLTTSDGEKIEVLKPGRHNHHAGPDFFDARIKIDKTLWAGNVEIHTKSTDWIKHNHHLDPLYRNTILHVVADEDIAVYNDQGSKIPTLTISWPHHIEENYESLLLKHDWVNCASELYKIDPFRIKFFLNGLAIERLKQKIENAEKLFEATSNDWNETFYCLMARSFGFKQNSEPFERVARSLLLSILMRHKDSLFQLEALLFGQSGMLTGELFGDPYFIALKNEYLFLSAKYQLNPIAGYQWKFMRMHPQNFPTIRIAQFAALIHTTSSLFGTFMKQKTVADFSHLFKFSISGYWDYHYTFNKESAFKCKVFGEEATSLTLINVIVPFLFFYGERTGQPELKDRSLAILESLPPENNQVIRHWKGAGVIVSNALESQSLLHLQHDYCEPVRCLECSIGHKIILHEP